jgi:septal ring factor EnvC (AmiA/AmiB activator)
VHNSLIAEQTAAQETENANLREIRCRREKKAALATATQNMEAKKSAIDQARQESDRTAHSLKANLEKAQKDSQVLLGDKTLLEQEVSMLLLQLSSARAKEKRMGPRITGPTRSVPGTRMAAGNEKSDPRHEVGFPRTSMASPRIWVGSRHGRAGCGTACIHP